MPHLSQLVVCALCLSGLLAAVSAFPSSVLVCGAGGRVGRAVVEKLLLSPNVTSVRALVRDPQKVEDDFSKLPNAPGKLEVVRGDLGREKDIKRACEGMEAAIWTASGFSDRSSPLNKLKGLFGIVLTPDDSIDVRGIARLGRAMKEEGSAPATGLPRVVLCSSAGVTRTTWDEEKAKRLEGAADIPIVRLNPFKILDTKRRGEQALRDTGVDYCIVRPTGLNDDWPEGRPVFSQGDVAVGRINRKDAADVLVKVLGCRSANKKTMECMALNGYPKGENLDGTLGRLLPDGANGPAMTEAAVEAEYLLLQQLLPGTTQDSAALAMGQSYEDMDEDKEGRLGKRGEERVPIVREN